MAKILIIDDEQDVIDSLSLVLETHGHQVQSLLETTDVVEKVKGLDPDLVILDVVFPEDPQAGFKAARALHKDAATSVIPVMLLSAVNIKSELAFGFSDADISEDFMPVQAFVDKPIEPSVLLERVASLLGD